MRRSAEATPAFLLALLSIRSRSTTALISGRDSGGGPRFLYNRRLSRTFPLDAAAPRGEKIPYRISTLPPHPRLPGSKVLQFGVASNLAQMHSSRVSMSLSKAERAAEPLGASRWLRFGGGWNMRRDCGSFRNIDILAIQGEMPFLLHWAKVGFGG